MCHNVSSFTIIVFLSAFRARRGGSAFRVCGNIPRTGGDGDYTEETERDDEEEERAFRMHRLESFSTRFGDIT